LKEQSKEELLNILDISKKIKKERNEGKVHE